MSKWFAAVQTQLQSLGQSTWAAQLMSYNLTTPGSINATVKTACHDMFGHWCLGELLFFFVL